MGLQFNLQNANWLAALLDPSRPFTISEPRVFRDALEDLIHARPFPFLSTPEIEHLFRDDLLRVLHDLEWMDGHPENLPLSVVHSRSRNFLWERWFRYQPWIACILPSVVDPEFDAFLSSHGFLRRLVDINPGHAGLILQPNVTEEGRPEFGLLDALPAFQQALNRIPEWPALLVWKESDVILLPIRRDRAGAEEDLRSALGLLYGGIDLGNVEVEYAANRRGEIKPPDRAIHLIHLSDVHIGSAEADVRLRRALALVRDLRDDLDGPKIPIVSGDLFDTPDRRHTAAVEGFLGDLKAATGEKPFCVVGNHDIRDGGFGFANPGQIMSVVAGQSPIKHYRKHGLTLVGFNSCETNDPGILARGEVSENQFYQIAEQLQTRRSGLRVGVVHHHPTRIPQPEWERRSWFRKLIDPLHKPTVEMRNGQQVVTFCADNRIGTLLHGHKHIPRLDSSSGVRIVGCGSSVGKIDTVDRNPYLSINVVTLLPESGRVITRLLAERTPGGGLRATLNDEWVTLT